MHRTPWAARAALLFCSVGLWLASGCEDAATGGTALPDTAADSAEPIDTADAADTTGPDDTVADGLTQDVHVNPDVPLRIDDSSESDTSATTDVAADSADPPPGCNSAVGTQISKTVGPEGGVLQLGAVALQIPPGALAAPTAITLDQTPEMLPVGVRALSAIYELGPASLVLAAPAQLTVTLPELPPAPEDVALFLGSAGGPYAAQATTLTGTTFAASVSGPGRGYAGWKTQVGAPPALACTPQGDQATLFDNFTNGNSYHNVYARRAGDQFAVTAAYQKDGLWTGRIHRFADAGSQGAEVNLFPGNFSALFGAHTSPAPGGTTLYAYDANPIGGSEVWVGRLGPNDAISAGPVNVSNDNFLSQQPQVVPLGTGAFVVWVAWNTTDPKRWLKGAFLDQELKVTGVIDITAPVFSSAPGTFAVVSNGAVAGVVWAHGGTPGNAGVRYQAFAGGCAVTPVIEVVSNQLAAPVLSAALRGPQLAVAYAYSNDNFRIRLLDLATGLLGPVRTYGPILSHPGIAAMLDGWVVAGVQPNTTKSDVSVLRLSAILDIEAAPTPIGQVSAYSQPTAVAADPTGGKVLVGWTSTGSNTVGGGPDKVQGLVRVLQCP